MGQLADLHRQLQIAGGGTPAPTQQDIEQAQVEMVVDAIRSIELSESESQDYTKVLEAIAPALVKAMTDNTKALVKALGGIEINPSFEVSNPINVETPSVTVENEIELPEQGPMEFEVIRREGQIVKMIARPYVEPEPEKPNYKIKSGAD